MDKSDSSKPNINEARETGDKSAPKMEDNSQLEYFLLFALVSGGSLILMKKSSLKK